MTATAKLRWTDPLSGQRLLAASMPKDASKEAKQRVFKQRYDELHNVYGAKAADTLDWDKGDGPEHDS